jgi:membrane protease YdiL (CAAX protease family)
MLLPTAVTWLYFIALAGEPAAIQLGAGAVGKAVQFALPVVFVFWIGRQRPKFAWARASDIAIGLASGAAIMAAMLGLYFLLLKPAGLMELAVAPAQQKVIGMGLDTWGRYAALGVFYALIHSLLEEYYWRWFVFGQLRKLVPLLPAVLLASTAFAAHHLLLLGTYFGYGSWQTLVFSLAVGMGGAIWAVVYERTGRLWAPWISHLLVDAGIFLIGADVVRSVML